MPASSNASSTVLQILGFSAGYPTLLIQVKDCQGALSQDCSQTTWSAKQQSVVPKSLGDRSSPVHAPFVQYRSKAQHSLEFLAEEIDLLAFVHMQCLELRQQTVDLLKDGHIRHATVPPASFCAILRLLGKSSPRSRHCRGLPAATYSVMMANHSSGGRYPIHSLGQSG